MTSLRLRVLVGDLSMTGVPVVLGRMLRWAEAHVDVVVDVVSVHGGPLTDEVAAAAASLTVLEPDHGRSPADAIGAGLATIGRPEWGDAVRTTAWRRRTPALPRPDVALVHGAGGWPLVAAVPDEVPLVVHLHELSTGMDRSIPVQHRRALYQRASTVMVVAQEVGDLAVRDGAPPERVVVIPGVVDPAEPRSPGATGTPERPLVGGLGAPGWRKGTDRFIALAHALGRSDPAVEVAWVGGRPVDADVAYAGGPDPVRWWPARPDPWEVLGAASVLVVPSREDALPLVALEAAVHRVPVVAAATGGLPALLADECGVVVAGHDLAELHRTVGELVRDPGGAAAMTARATDRVARHHVPSVVGPRWWDALTAAAAGA